METYQDIYAVSGLQGDGKNITLGLDPNFFRALGTSDSKAILRAANDGATAGIWLHPLSGKAGGSIWTGLRQAPASGRMGT